MPTEKIKITSRENRTRREDSKSREKDGRSSKRSSSTVKSLEDGKHKSDKYRGDGVDGRAATKRRDDSKSRSSVPRQRVDDSVAGSRSSRRSDATSRSETSKRSDRMRSTERSYKSTSNKYGDGANKSEERHKSQRRGLEKRQTDSGAKNIRNNLDDTSRKFSRNLKEDGQKRKNEVHRRNSTTKDTRLKNEVKNSINEEHKKSSTRRDKNSKSEEKILKEKVQKRHALNDYEEIPSTSKQSSYLSPKTVKENKLQNTLKENSDGSDYNYEDDFEDYESDFEEDDDDDDDDNDDNEIESEKINSDIDDDKINNDKTETVIEESEHKNNLKTEEDNPFNYLKRSKSSRYYEEQPYGNDWEVPKKVNQLQNYTRTFINFKTVQKQQERKKASNKLRKRGTELLEIITLDQMTFDLFELPPVKYDVYIRRFGRSNTKQVFVQTEYGHDEEIQTDEINSREKWTQIPPNDQHGFGGDLEEENSKNVTWNSRLKTDAIYLNKFVQNVGQMILHVLEEELADVNLQKLSENYTNINFSQGFIQTGSLSLLAESPITYLSFSNIKTNFLLSVHSTSINQIPNSVLNEKGIICIWNINQPLKPERILTSNGQPSCCCFGPENIDIVIAGMIDGSIALWDLQEEASSHPQIVLDEKEWSIRTPTYNTATVLREEGHHSCVVAIKTLPYSSSGDVSSPSKKKLNSIRNFHVISLEDLSVIHIWIAMEIAKQEVSSLEGDLGLAPWGKVKLIKSSSIKLYNLHGLGDVMKFGFRSFDFQIVPSNSSHMLITTDTGAVIHCTRFNSKIIPRLYISNSELLIEARCIDISPHDLPLFMVGCNDGSIRLHDIKLERPLLSWSDSTNGKPVKQIKWSPSQPSVFFVMDADSRIYIWDLSQNISSPVEICELSQNGISCLCFSCDAEVNKKAYSGWPPHLAMARENGILEIHQLGKKFSTLSPQQYEKQKQVLLNL